MEAPLERFSYLRHQVPFQGPYLVFVGLYVWDCGIVFYGLLEDCFFEGSLMLEEHRCTSCFFVDASPHPFFLVKLRLRYFEGSSSG